MIYGDIDSRSAAFALKEFASAPKDGYFGRLSRLHDLRARTAKWTFRLAHWLWKSHARTAALVELAELEAWQSRQPKTVKFRRYTSLKETQA